MFSMILGALVALAITCYAYAYVGVYTRIYDPLATAVFYGLIYTIVRVCFSYTLNI
jgi:hypothetical protein